jgi:hypothetical protein
VVSTLRAAHCGACEGRPTELKCRGPVLGVTNRQLTSVPEGANTINLNAGQIIGRAKTASRSTRLKAGPRT